jgi:hypothetical protein
MLTLDVTINGIPISSRAEIEELYRFLGMYLHFTPPPEYRKEEETKPVPAVNSREHISIPDAVHRVAFGGHNPPIGETKNDYIDRVLVQYPDGLTTVQLVDKMRQAGWKTNAADPMRVVRNGLYYGREKYIHLPNGKWIFRKSKQSPVVTVEEKQHSNQETNMPPQSSGMGLFPSNNE